MAYDMQLSLIKDSHFPAAHVGSLTLLSAFSRVTFHCFERSGMPRAMLLDQCFYVRGSGNFYNK